MVIVWRMRGKIIGTVPCWIMYHSSVKPYAHSYEHFLQLGELARACQIPQHFPKFCIMDVEVCGS